MRPRNRSPSPHRRIRRSSGRDTCWRERSKYGTPVRQMASTSPSVRSLGYRYSSRTRATRAATASHQRDDRALPHALVPAERGEVLGDQHDLDRAELVDLAEDRRRSSATAAGPGTTGWRRTRRPGRSPRPPSRRPTGPRPAGGAGSAGRTTARSGPGLAPSVTGTPKPAHRVGLGQRLGQLVAVALGEAAGDDEPAPVLPAAVEREHGVDRLLPGVLDEGAGVHHHQIGTIGAARKLIALARPACRSACPSRPGSSGSPWSRPSSCVKARGTSLPTAETGRSGRDGVRRLARARFDLLRRSASPIRVGRERCSG